MSFQHLLSLPKLSYSHRFSGDRGGEPHSQGAVCGGYCCQMYGWSEQKNGILKSRKDMFSDPMRRGWGSSGGPTGQGRVPGAFGRGGGHGRRERRGRGSGRREREGEAEGEGEGEGEGEEEEEGVAVRGREWPREKEREGARNEI